MAIPVYLQQFKAAGIYRVVFDKSTVLNQDSSTLRMVAGYSDKGPFNIPTYIRSVGDFKALYGDISKTLEKRGDFFHRTAIQMLAAGPILALNLKKFENEVVGGTQIDTTFNTAYAINTVEIPVEDVYDTTSFWELSAEKLNDIRGAEYINIATTNTKATSGTYFIRKASGNKVSGWNITVSDWYSDAHEDVPEFLLGKENQKMSAFMAEIYVFKGKFTADQVLASSSLKKYFEVNLDGKLVLKQYVTNAFGDSVDTLDALYMDETSNAIGHYVGSLIPELRDKNGVYASLDVLFNQDQTVHNMMMSLNTDMLYEDGTAQIDLSGIYNISTHDNGNQHDQGHKFAAGNVPYGAKPLCLDDIFDGIAVSNLLGNSNSPIVSDVVEFRTSVYNDEDVVKYAFKYQNSKKVTGALYVSHISGSNITLSHVGNNGTENIMVDCAAADDMNYILYQLGAAYEYKHPNEDHSGMVTEYIPYESGLGTYFEGVNAYDLPTNLQGPKKIITSISRDVKSADDDTILLGGNKIKCTTEDVYITTKSQYKNTLIGDSVKIVSNEEYQKMLEDAGYGSAGELNSLEYISKNVYLDKSDSVAPYKSQYRAYSEIVAYQKYDYVTLPKIADEEIAGTKFTWQPLETSQTIDGVKRYAPGYVKETDCTIAEGDAYVKAYVSSTQTYYYMPVEQATDSNGVAIPNEYLYVDYNGIVWHEVGDVYGIKNTNTTEDPWTGDKTGNYEYVSSVDGSIRLANVECPEHLYWHAIIPYKSFEVKSDWEKYKNKLPEYFGSENALNAKFATQSDSTNQTNFREVKLAASNLDPKITITYDIDYVGYDITVKYPAVKDNTLYYEYVANKTGWKPVYDETKWFLITDSDLLGYDPHKWINKISVAQWKALKEVNVALANNYRAGFDVVAYQKYDYVCHWSTSPTGETLDGGSTGKGTKKVDLSYTDTNLQNIPVTDNKFTDPSTGIEWHLVIDERCKKLLYAHTIISNESFDSLDDNTGWKAIYQVTYYYRIITNSAYKKLPSYGTGIINNSVVVGQKVGYNEATAAAYNATLEGAVAAGDIKEDAVLYTANEIAEHNATLDIWDNTTVKTEAVLYTYDEYTALEGKENTTTEAFDNLTDTEKTKEDAVLYTADEIAEHNATLDIWDNTTVKTEAVTYTADTAAAYNATLEGAVKSGSEEEAHYDGYGEIDTTHNLVTCVDVYSSWSVYQWINGSILTNESWNVYGSSVTFVGVDTTVWSLESDVSADADTELYTYTFKASASDDQSVLTFFQKGDAILAEDATTDSDGDGEYDDEVANGLYDICYVQETGTEYDENGVPTTYWVKFTGKPAIYSRDNVNYVVVLNSSLNQEIGTMEPQYLKGYTYEHSKPEGTNMMAKLKWQKYMLSALTDYKGLRKGLMSKAEIQYRYVVDGFESYVQAGLKNELSFLCKEKQNAFAIANFPSVRTFVKCPYTSFVDDKGVFNVEYVVKGYNKKKAAVTRFDLPSTDEGASFIAFYSPLKFSDGYIDSTVPSAGLVSNLFMEKYMSRQPYYIVAGPNYASISASGLVGPDYHYSDDELNLIEPFGVNCMVYRPGFGTFVNANQTAKQTPVSALSKVHIRELVIFLQDEVAKILQAYQWEFNNQVVRNKIKDRADYICNQIKANGGLFDFINIMDESNNTPEIIDNEMAILSTHIEPGRGMGKMIHELTLYKTGEMRSMIAGE